MSALIEQEPSHSPAGILGRGSALPWKTRTGEETLPGGNNGVIQAGKEASLQAWQRQSRKPKLHWFRNGGRHKEPKPTSEVEWEGWAVCHQWSNIHGLSLPQRKESGSSLPSVLRLPKAGCGISIYGSSLGERVAHGMTRRRMSFFKAL